MSPTGGERSILHFIAKLKYLFKFYKYLMCPTIFTITTTILITTMILTTIKMTAATTRTTIFVQFADLGIEHVQCSTDLATLPYDLSNLIEVTLYVLYQEIYANRYAS